jgi:hypothetical protein
MKKLLKEFRKLFKKLGPDDNLINMYLVFMGVRSACLIDNIDIFDNIPLEANLEIYYEIYPGYKKNRTDYPLVCLKNSWVSRYINKYTGELTEEELGLYLGFNCFDQEWKNLRINRYEIIYILGNIQFYTEVCSIKPDVGMLTRIYFKAKEMNAALKLIDNRFNVKYQINLVPPMASKNKRRRQ